MDEKDINNYINRYTDRYNEFGYSPETLGWGKNGKQDTRFAVLGEMAIKDKKSSLLDVGCGFADLYSFLKLRGWEGEYTGIDIVPVLVEKAREIYPGINISQKDIQTPGIENADYVIASGIFNAKLINDDNEQHIENSVKKMFELCNKAVCIDFMSSYVDFQKEGSWHTDPAWALQLARKFTKRFIIRYDFMPYEFALILFKDDNISPLNIFQDFNQ